MNTGRDLLGGAGGENSTSLLVFGGRNPSVTAITENWNGSSWTEVADLSEARRFYNSGTGTSLAAIGAGGYTTTLVNSVEEWTVPSSLSNLTITD